MGKLKFYLDLDTTLLNTVLLIENFKQLLIANGIPREAVDIFYKTSTVNVIYRSRTFYVIRHLEEMSNHFGVSASKLATMRGAVDSFIDMMPDYIYPDAWRLLGAIPKDQLILITYGGAALQNLKIDKAGIRDCFEHIVITSGIQKSEALQNLVTGGQIAPIRGGVFVDDRAREIEQMRVAFPGLTGIVIHRKNGLFNSEVGVWDRQITTLDELLDDFNFEKTIEK